MNNLKTTGLRTIPAEALSNPFVVTIEMTDKTGGVYESEIHMDKFDRKYLVEAITESFKMCEHPVVSVNVKSIKVKK